jgi:hypothetical protein
MDRGEHAQALEVFDQRFSGPLDTVLPRIDATALLWRLMLEGVDIASRFGPVADAWEASLETEGGFYAFNDFHAAMALAAVGRREALGRLRAMTGRALIERHANAAMTRAVGLQACEAAIDWCEGRFDAATRHLVAVRDAASAFGGSHAQRDLLSLTLIDAATRAGLADLARHVANERLVHKPESAWGKRLVQRIEARGARLAA